ncbi:MAG: hypothetical protein AB1324_04030 [Candidatus Micrarchaeota archaeon]
MKITTDGQRMVLKDHNFTQFLGGLLFFLVGAAIMYFLFSEGLVLIVFGAIFALAGLYLIAITKIVTVTLDKGAGKATVSLRGLVGGGTRDVDLGKVKKVNLRKTYSTTRSGKGGSSTKYVYIVALVLEGGEEMPFELATVSASITDVLVSPDEKHKADAKGIADFLGVPLEWFPAPSMMDALNAVKEGIAEGMERMKRD